MRKHCLRNYLECPVESKDLTQPIYMEKNRGRCRYVRIKPENVMHARRKGIRTTTVDLAEIAHSSVSGDLSTKSSKQVNHAPEEGTNGPHNLCRAASLSAGKQAIWTAESNSIPKSTKHVEDPRHSLRWTGWPTNDKLLPLETNS